MSSTRASAKVLNRKLNDIEYFYESHLPGEGVPVSERHAHPAEPRTVRVALKMCF